jgi:methionine synthase II (cobalamin-independent)
MISNNFHPDCRGLLIGSLPLTDHLEAQNLVLKYTPEIPLWVQLPAYREEGMMLQFLPGMPGLTVMDQRTFIDTESAKFDEELLAFYEDYTAISENTMPLGGSRFALTPDTAKGFFAFMEMLKTGGSSLVALKGQITGPITLSTGITDQQGRAIYHNEQVRDAAVKLIAMKARWQIRNMAVLGKPTILFFDEPSLASFGSSAFISVSKEDILACFEEVIEAVHEEGGLAGIHVCGNTDWSLVLESSSDIISFDAHAYFDRFILYPDLIKRFMAAGKFLAWGIVPSLNTEDIDGETASSLTSSWHEKVGNIEALGIDRKTIMAQSFITPSCGTGSLSRPYAEKVLELTRAVSRNIRGLRSEV